MLLLLTACEQPVLVIVERPRQPHPEEEESAAPPTCPEEMALVSDAEGQARFCVDRYEAWIDGELGNKDQGASWPDGSTTGVARSLVGVLPTPTSWYQAAAACLNAGKVLCTPQMWADACDGTFGEGGLGWPYGDQEDPSACVTLDLAEQPQVDAPQLTGSYPRCVSPFGVYDQVGNYWEWTDPERVDEGGAPVTHKVGGAWYAGRGSSTCFDQGFEEHPPGFDGLISARCCIDLTQ